MIQNGDLTQKLKKEKTITTHHSLSGFPLPIEQQSAFFQIFERLEDTQILLRSCPRIHQSEGIHFDGPRRMAGAWLAHGAWLCHVSYTKRLVPDISPGIDDCPSLAAMSPAKIPVAESS